MTRSKLVADVASTLFLCAILFYAWRSEYYHIALAAGVVSIAASAYSALRTKPADVERVRREAWLVPVATLVIAAPLIYGAAPEVRVRALVLGVGVIGAGLVIYFLRRRVA